MGVAFTSGGNADAFLYDIIHVTIDLNTLISPSSGCASQHANAISDMGRIAGVGTIGGQQHAFLLTPIVPEPSTLALAVMGVIVLGAWGWRRRRT